MEKKLGKVPRMYYLQDDDLEQIRLADESSMDSADPMEDDFYKENEDSRKQFVLKMRKKGMPLKGEK